MTTRSVLLAGALLTVLCASPFIAGAATPASSAPGKGETIPGASDTQTVIRVPAWRIGDKASFRYQRTLSMQNMDESALDMETPNYRARLNVEVVAEADDGAMIHRWRIQASPANMPPVPNAVGHFTPNLPIPSTPIDLEVSEDGTSVEVVNLEDLIRESRESYENDFKRRRPELWELRTDFHRKLLDDMFDAVRFQQALLEILEPVYELGNGDFRADPGHAEPFTRNMAGTDISLQGYGHRTVVTSGRDRTATVLAAQVLSGDQLAHAQNQLLDPILKDLAINTPEFRAERLRKLNQLMADTGMGFTTQVKVLADDGEAWPRLVESSRVVSGVEKGKRFSSTFEIRVDRDVHVHEPATAPELPSSPK